MSAKDAYRRLCAQREDIPLFMQPLWLDQVCVDRHWEVALSCDAGGEIRGAWAYAPVRRFGMTWLRLPPLTPYTGVWMRIDEGLRIQERLKLRQDILGELEAQMPRAAVFEMKVHWSLDDWLPLYWRGYRQQTHYTFRFPQSDPETIYDQLSKSYRRNLRAAERQCVTVDGTSEEAWPLIENVFRMRQSRIPFKPELLQQIAETPACRCRISMARDEKGTAVACIVTVSDAHTTYYLLGGRSETESVHCTELLLWHAIKDAATHGQAFDFEGSMMEGVHGFFQKFGAQLTPYSLIYKYRGLARVKYLRRV